MEVTIRLYHTLFGNRGYVRSLGEGFVFFAASTIAIFASVSCDGPRQQLCHGFGSEPRGAL